MQKINFVNNQAPYINADNLNAMQNNIETSINAISTKTFSTTTVGFENDLEEFKTEVINNALVGNSNYYLNFNGAIYGAFVLKASSNYASFLLYNYDTMLAQYNYNNGTWTSWSNGISSGSNSNGNWIKYADGTMICWNSKTENNVAINQQYGNLYSNTKYYNFPQSFISNPTGICSEFKYGTSASWGTVNSISTTEIGCRGLDAVSREAGENVKISWVAIGRWK